MSKQKDPKRVYFVTWPGVTRISDMMGPFVTLRGAEALREFHDTSSPEDAPHRVVTYERVDT